MTRIVCEERRGPLATAIYATTDDMLKEYSDLAPWRPPVGITSRLSDAELVTLATMRPQHLEEPQISSESLAVDWFPVEHSPTPHTGDVPEPVTFAIR